MKKTILIILLLFIASCTPPKKTISEQYNEMYNKYHKDEYVYEEIKYIKECCKGKLLKVIIETCLLTEEEKVRACELSKKAGADYVKTSTGFSTGGATVSDIALMRKTVGPDLGVKASGGVRSYEDMVNMVEAGATRIGTSSGPKLVK